jgi:hypothetical protein
VSVEPIGEDAENGNGGEGDGPASIPTQNGDLDAVA